MEKIIKSLENVIAQFQTNELADHMTDFSKEYSIHLIHSIIYSLYKANTYMVVTVESSILTLEIIIKNIRFYNDDFTTQMVFFTSLLNSEKEKLISVLKKLKAEEVYL